MCDAPPESQKLLGKRLNKSQGMKPWKKNGIAISVMKCDACGLIYSNPQPVPFDLQDHYGVLPEDYWSKDYFILKEDHFEGEIRQLKSLIDFKPGMKTLDVGAGLGKSMLALKKAGFDSYGLEPSAQFRDRAIAKMGIEEEKIRHGQIETTDYPENTFDFISFLSVLEHLYEPSEALQKAFRWLKPGGIVHVEVPSADWLIHKIVNFYYKLMGTDYVANLSPMHEPYHLYEFSLETFRKHSLTHGYELAHHEYYVCETYLPKIADGILKPYMRSTGTGMMLCVYLRKK